MKSEPSDHEVQLATRSEPTSPERASLDATPDAESSALQRMRLERDAALEDVAFLREQLRSTEAFYTHRLELEEERLHAVHRSLFEELTRLSAERQRRTHGVPARREEARGASSAPDGEPPFPWTR